MRYRNLGSSGLVVSVLGVGCNAFGARTDADEVDAIVGEALEQGITLFDTADTYSAGESERLLGAALQGRRDRAVVATKFGMPVTEDDGPDGLARGSRRYIRQAVEASLRRLGTDRIDLLQMHTPDPKTPIGETLRVLNDLVSEGKVRHIGSSNFSADQLYEADFVARENGFVRFTSAQSEYSLVERGVEAGVLPACRDLGLGFLPYFPLKSGLLTGKYTREGGTGRLTTRPKILAGANWEQLDAYRALCDEHGLTMLQASIGWLLAQDPVSSVISGATTPEQVAQNAGAGEIALPDALLDQIGELF